MFIIRFVSFIYLVKMFLVFNILLLKRENQVMKVIFCLFYIIIYRQVLISSVFKLKIIKFICYLGLVVVFLENKEVYVGEGQGK